MTITTAEAVAGDSRPAPRRTGRPPKYPWDTWLDGEVHTLQPGVDFRVSSYNMRRQILLEARKREIVVETAVKQGWIQIRPGEAKTPDRTDWDAVFEQDPAVLEQGTDFHGTPESMVSAARRAAGRRQLKCSISVSPDGVLTIRSWRDPSTIGLPVTEMAPDEGE